MYRSLIHKVLEYSSMFKFGRDNTTVIKKLFYILYLSFVSPIFFFGIFNKLPLEFTHWFCKYYKIKNIIILSNLVKNSPYFPISYFRFPIFRKAYLPNRTIPHDFWCRTLHDQCKERVKIIFVFWHDKRIFS